MRLTVKGNVKQKKNNKRIARNRKTGASFIMTDKKTTDYINDAVKQLREQFEGYEITDYPIKVQMFFWYPTRHRKDIDNSTSTLLDCMKDAGVIIDDDVRYVNEVHSFFSGYDKENPRVEILIED